MSQLGTKKSRRGCKRCKQRRVKCDELIPCTNCVRRSEECSLLEPTPSGSSEGTYDPSLPRSGEEWIDDLELMFHYSSNTSNNFLSLRAEAQVIWSQYVPAQAMKYPFLMHGLLALAALHLAYLRPEAEGKYLQLCDKHQTAALKHFREILSSDIDPELADSLFALSAVMSTSSMARQCIANERRALDMDAITEIFFLTRGVRDVIQIFHDRIRNGPMFAMFENQQPPEGVEVKLPLSVRQQFESVNQMLIEYGLDPEALVHCQSALRDLETVYRNINYFAPIAYIQSGSVFRWTVDVSTGFVRLVQAHNPPALVLVAYYAAAFTAVRKSWYTTNFPEFAIRGISQVLDESMHRWIEWPQQQLVERMAVLGVQPAQGERSSPRPLIGN